MAAMAESPTRHVVKNIGLFFLSVIFLPIDTSAVLIGLLLSLFRGESRVNASQPKKVLVTGVSMSKGLAIARLLHQQGHTVVGADRYHLSSGRASRAIRKFYVLPQFTHSVGGRDEMERDPYIARLLEIVRSERVDLWIPASDVHGALHDGLAKDIVESRTSAKVVQLGFDDVATMDDKASFMELVRSLGLAMPVTQRVDSASALQAFLATKQQLSFRPGGAQYIVKPIGVNDVARYDMPLLPFRTEEETIARIKAIPFTRDTNFIVQEYIKGDEFCTHALVIRGQVRAFVACPSSELLMHYTALPSSSPLSSAMLEFTKRVASAGGASWTGHVSFDFLVRHSQDHDGDAQKPIIYPIECNPRVHTAVLLFQQTPELVDEYLSALEMDKHDQREPLHPLRPHRVYWIGQDIVESVFYPTYEALFRGTIGLDSVVKNVDVFVERLRYWKDGIFELWDPMPFWWTYHVQWPLLFLRYVFKGKWHKVNISTGKIFEAA
ncbi:hypothetical protein E4U43_007900 [Claviceps pusilla]|uniref:ATP-grasp domain-containing protein n=1 Tax=Claviceps pusilla TaxID=123648 RepID=A0A9P7NC16_9HYPO|nr:hypothetical protein E4U43_007900 [Claviceps pusilla]